MYIQYIYSKIEMINADTDYLLCYEVMEIKMVAENNNN